MLTANVGHGQAVPGCGMASASPARSRVPIAPPAKMAATSRRSTRGQAGPTDDSGMRTGSFHAGKEAISRSRRRFGRSQPPRQGVIWLDHLMRCWPRARGWRAMAVLDTDVAVIGAGSVGSMASWQLAARGLRVIGIDRFMVPGPFSAYAGESRVFRMVYAEGGHYTPLLQRARDLWRELEAASGNELLTITGVVTVMDHDHPDHAALLRAGRERGLRFEVVAGADARRRLPDHLIRDDDVALF